ncbi:protein Dhp61 [Bacillus sp. S14(2024)]|uniref:protein Dhp61 n=1 Tax=Bacillus sp. S14(2024) TaxID=3162884 RepID=UPI003D19687D
MKNKYTSYAKLKLTYQYKFINIDLANKLFTIDIIDVKNERIILTISMDLSKDTVEIEGNLKDFPHNIEETLFSLKSTANDCIKNNISNSNQL